MKKCCEEYLNGQFGTDAEVIAEIYNEYVSSVHEKLAEAREALEDGDWQALDRTAHTIKGNALAAGDQEMADTAIELRKAATLKDAAQSERLVGAIEEFAKGL